MAGKVRVKFYVQKKYGQNVEIFKILLFNNVIEVPVLFLVFIHNHMLANDLCAFQSSFGVRVFFFNEYKIKD